MSHGTTLLFSISSTEVLPILQKGFGTQTGLWPLVMPCWQTAFCFSCLRNSTIVQMVQIVQQFKAVMKADLNRRWLSQHLWKSHLVMLTFVQMGQFTLGGRGRCVKAILFDFVPFAFLPFANSTDTWAWLGANTERLAAAVQASINIKQKP